MFRFYRFLFSHNYGVSGSVKVEANE